ncbi:hypothetical protein JTE90_028739 [Oedothorax gibbosus]|uniref:C2H2-type domain-containing protein n=1 Tax=Oedothorax gibbosus TaxID=931172 RepID=A0AAV6UEX8_9ARAC|nr:hypothetical protein JTE90_028739 [Oedothorax gibbosus]
MFLCYVCETEIHISSERGLINHLRFHEVRDGLKRAILCKQPGCKCGSFATVNSLVRHFKKFHPKEFTAVDSGKYTCGPSILPAIEVKTPEKNPSVKVNESHKNTDIQIKVALLASLRANSSVPHSIILEVAKTCNNIEKIATDRALNIVYNHLSEVENGSTMHSEIPREVEEALTTTKTPHTTYEIAKHFENHDLFVKPRTVMLGDRFEHRVNNGQSEDALVYDTFEYMSVKETLEVLRKNNNDGSSLTLLLTPEITAAILEEGVEPKDVFFLLADQDLKDLSFNMSTRQVILNMKPQEATQNQNTITNSQLPRLAEVVDVQLVSPVITAGVQLISPELPADAQVIPPVTDVEPGPAAIHQPLELYYDPVSHTGFLEHFIRGRRSSDPNIATWEYGKRKHEVEASTSIKDANDYMARNKLTSSNKTDMETALDLTRKQRRNWILGPEKPSITIILKKYPRFQDMNASETSLQEALNILEERGMKQPGIFTIEDAYYLKLDKTAVRLSASNIRAGPRVGRSGRPPGAQ